MIQKEFKGIDSEFSMQRNSVKQWKGSHMKADLKNDRPAFELTMDLITGYLQNNKVPHNELNDFISQTFDTVLGFADKKPSARSVGVSASAATSPSAPAPATAEASEQPVKRGRGRPRLVRAEEAAPANPQTSLSFLAGDVIGTAPPKRRGRPPKVRPEEQAVEAAPSDAAAPVAAAEEPGAFSNIPKVPYHGIDPEGAIGHDKLTCLVCGKQRKILTRHLATDHGMTPDDYRSHFGLRADYPVTAEASSEKRSVLTKSAFAARRGDETEESAEEAPAPVPAAAAAVEPAVKRGRGRPPKAASAKEAKVVKRGPRKSDQSGMSA